MRIKSHERVVRYDCEFNERETIALKQIGFLPPDASERAPLSITGPEILDTLALLYGKDARERAAEMCRAYAGACFCGAHRSDLV